MRFKECFRLTIYLFASIKHLPLSLPFLLYVPIKWSANNLNKTIQTCKLAIKRLPRKIANNCQKTIVAISDRLSVLFLRLHFLNTNVRFIQMTTRFHDLISALISNYKTNETSWIFINMPRAMWKERKTN